MHGGLTVADLGPSWRGISGTSPATMRQRFAVRSMASTLVSSPRIVESAIVDAGFLPWASRRVATYSSMRRWLIKSDSHTALTRPTKLCTRWATTSRVPTLTWRRLPPSNQSIDHGARLPELGDDQQLAVLDGRTPRRNS